MPSPMASSEQRRREAVDALTPSPPRHRRAPAISLLRSAVPLCKVCLAESYARVCSGTCPGANTVLKTSVGAEHTLSGKSRSARFGSCSNSAHRHDARELTSAYNTHTTHPQHDSAHGNQHDCDVVHLPTLWSKASLLGSGISSVACAAGFATAPPSMVLPVCLQLEE